MKRAIAFLSLALASPALAAPIAIGFAPLFRDVPSGGACGWLGLCRHSCSCL